MIDLNWRNNDTLNISAGVNMAHCVGNLVMQQEQLGHVYFYVLRCFMRGFQPLFFFV